MASVWIERRKTRSGALRYRVVYQLGGRGQSRRYGGSFPTLSDARRRRTYIVSELAAYRIPELMMEAPPAPLTVAEAGAAWGASRIDVAPGTRTQHRVALQRMTKLLGTIPVRDELTIEHVVNAIARLHALGRKRETIAKSVGALRMVLDFAAVEPNVARDRRVKPPARSAQVAPPDADAVEAVLSACAPRYRLPLLLLDATGLRVSEIERLHWGDLDEPTGRFRISRGADPRTGESACRLNISPDLFAARRGARSSGRSWCRRAAVFPELTQARLPHRHRARVSRHGDAAVEPSRPPAPAPEASGTSTASRSPRWPGGSVSASSRSRSTPTRTSSSTAREVERQELLRGPAP